MAASSPGATTGDRDHQLRNVPTDAAYVAIACGLRLSVALRNDGGVVSWGCRAEARPPPNAGFVAIACGGFQSVALRRDGRIVIWGDDTEEQRRHTPTGAGYVAIACGKTHSVALHDDGTVDAWGSDASAQLFGAPTDAGYVAVACDCNSNESVLLRGDGRVASWSLPDSPTDPAYAPPLDYYLTKSDW